MFENIGHFFKRMVIKPEQKELGSKDAAKERLHLVLMQDRANVSADFLELMKQEIIDVIKKYIIVDESSIDVRLTNQSNDDGTNGAPALYANIPIVNIKNDMMAEKVKAFEGVDFNKEMGIYISEETEKNELQEDAEKIEENNIQDVSENNIENKEDIQEENNNDKENENQENSDEDSEDIQDSNIDYVDDDDDDDDDVTFDDLLKAAEEEEKKNKKN